MQPPLTSQRGYSLIELMIYIVISTSLMAAMYQGFYNQQKIYREQSSITEMHQGMRGSMYLLTKDLRAAGYDPTETVAAGTLGFQRSFAAPHNTFVIDYGTARNIIALTADANGNGAIDATYEELIAYRHDPATRTLQRYNAGTQAWEAIADNVDVVDFVYLQANGARAVRPQDIRAVEIALLVREPKPVKNYTDTNTYRNRQGEDICPTACRGTHYHRRLITTSVQPRNMPIHQARFDALP